MVGEIKDTQAQAPELGIDRRRSRRLVLTVPVTIEWKNVQGEMVKDLATAKNVSIHGATLLLAEGKHALAVNAEISLKSSFSGESAQARVVRVKRLASGKLESLAVELLAATQTFWGLTFQLQLATAQLLEIETACQAHLRSVDFRVLKSLTEAVDQLRGIASIIQEWQELQIARKNAYSVLDALASARVERATNILGELTNDIDASELVINSEDYAKLVKALERLSDRILRGTHVYGEIR